jgi:dihydroflavonol-4-reductase
MCRGSPSRECKERLRLTAGGTTDRKNHILNAAKDALGLKRAVSYLPICFAKMVAPFYERKSLRKKQTLYFTPYAIAVLDSNGRLDRSAAAASFGDSPRSLQNNVRDTVIWLKKTGRS